MKNEKYIQSFNKIEPDDGAKERMLNKIICLVKSGKPKTIREGCLINTTMKRLSPIAACLVIAIAAVIALPHFTNINNGNIISQGNESGSSMNSMEPPVTTDLSTGNASADTGLSDPTAFKGFILTAYAAKEPGEVLSVNYLTETTPTELQPNVEVLLASYTPILNSVPGLPFTIENSNEALMARVSVDNGELLMWDIESGMITPCGQSVEIENGVTLYWSPIAESNAVNEATIIVTATDGKKDFGVQTISVTYDGQFYRATAGEFQII